MLPNVERLTRLHTQALQALECVHEAADCARKLAKTLAAKRMISEAESQGISELSARWREAFRTYHATADSNEMIKLWFMLLDMWHAACLSHDRPGPVIGWDGKNEIDAMHCHEALDLTCSKISQATFQIGTNAPSLDGVRSLLETPALAVVCAPEFEAGLNEEFEIGCKTLTSQLGYGVPMCADMEHCATFRILWRVSERACGCAYLARELRRQFGRPPLLSTDSWAAGHQAREEYDRVIQLTHEIDAKVFELNRHFDLHETFQMVKSANLDSLTPIVIADQTYATAHEAAIGMAERVSSIVWGTEGESDKLWLLNLARRLRKQKLPNLDAQLDIEKARAERWLDEWLKGAKKLENPDRESDEVGPSEVLDAESVSVPPKKRKQGRPSKRTDPEVALLERRFDAVYQKLGLDEACRECGVSRVEGNRIRLRLLMRRKRNQGDL